VSSSNPKTPAVAESLLQSMKARGEQFAVATVVRTVSVTAAKPGAKAVINASGEIVDGWIGGGCARNAVLKAAAKAFIDGEPKLVTLQPQELLAEQGLTAGEEQDGVMAASNMCPSKGSMEIFVEPVLADPELLILGASPVAMILAELAQPFGFCVSVAGCSDPAQSNSTLSHYACYGDIPSDHSHRYIVIATQGSRDLDALQAALQLQTRYIGFVGSRKKTLHLKERLIELGSTAPSLTRIKGPAGLDIGGVTPQEIALSILAEITQFRREKAVSSPNEIQPDNN